MTLLESFRSVRLTLLGRSLLLLTCELLANVLCWIVAGVLFGRSHETKSILGLAMLAWTLGLRHALDADHISAIDNATRGLIAMGQLSVTCGLFFSLGHSTIVIVVNIAIAISTNIANRLDEVGQIGGIIGSAISGSFLFIVALMNSIILFKLIRRRKVREKRIYTTSEDTVPYNPKDDHMLMMRMIGPIVTFVNKPWKMYPVGVLFGLGFDTTSSIALLAVSALAVKDSNGNAIPSRDVVILPLLFTAGMTLVDSLDSILMLYSYSGFPERSFRIIEKKNSNNSLGVEGPTDPESSRSMRVKQNAISGLSIILTIMSILLAFSISLIEIIALIGDNCTPCQNAANADNGGGLAGRWWRAWDVANNNIGYIGAAIVGVFALVVGSWYALACVVRKTQSRRHKTAQGTPITATIEKECSNQNEDVDIGLA
ncbi:NicO-domain-containing protein [Gymnopus androsaceus JB14]|uniref:Nickel/cobalt efflux system n=1 Tax=Gymnopus androsaceus JB14 TaxID=1447944 RepID=A0A6A4H534_9AGAR|nr:NicO-domain-containing protein [Gymnopus androsaceus JB14]